MAYNFDEYLIYLYTNGDLLMFGVSKKIFFFYSILCSFLFLLFVLTIQDISYIDLDIIMFYISFYVFGFFILNDYLISRSFFSFGIMFNIWGLLYTNYYIGELIMMGGHINNTDSLMMYCGYLSMLAFNITFYSYQNKGEIVHNSMIQDANEFLKRYDFGRIRALLFAFLLFSALIGYYVINDAGYINIAFQSRMKTSLLMQQYGAFGSVFRAVIPYISAIFLYFYFISRKKMDFIIALLGFGIGIFLSFMYGSRSQFLVTLFPWLFLFWYSNKLSNKYLLVVGVMLFLLFGIWKSIYSDAMTISYTYTEFSAWYMIASNMLGQGNEECRYGVDYLKTLINLIVPITGMETLGTYYVRTYLPSTWLAGGGKGFSGVLEAYLNFGLMGEIIVFGFYGYLLRKVTTLPNTGLRIFLYLAIVTSMNGFFRSESYALWKGMIWFKIYPMFLILFFSRRKSEIQHELINNRKPLKSSL